MTFLQTVALSDMLDDDSADTLARRALAQGRPQDVAGFLGEPWTVRAPVEHGDARGRTIGFPTANMHLELDAPLAFGIYAVRVSFQGDDGSAVYRGGVANFGIRPMYRTKRPLLETHLFDFSGDLYGKMLAVELITWLRPEAMFASLDALVEQIKQDAAAARMVLASDRAPSTQSLGR